MTADWHRRRDAALLVLAGQGRASERAEAAASLLELAHEQRERGAELVELLPRLIGDRQPEVRRSAAALGALLLAHEEALRFLSMRLEDPVAEVRMEAAGQLADLALPESRGTLAVALEDSAFPVRFEAARGMAALRHGAGLDVLLEALDWHGLRFRALGALALLGDARAAPSVKRLFKRWFLPYFDRTQAAGVLARLGDPEGATHLLARTRKRGAVDRAYAIELCGEVKVPAALERLLEILGDRADDCRGAAARGLGRLGDARALDPLAALLEDLGAHEELRLDAAHGLCLLGLPEARERVERAVPSLASPEAREELRQMLEESA